MHHEEVFVCRADRPSKHLRTFSRRIRSLQMVASAMNCRGGWDESTSSRRISTKAVRKCYKRNKPVRRLS